MIQFILYRQESRGKFLAVDCIYRGLQAVIPWGMQLSLPSFKNRMEISGWDNAM